MKFAPRPTVTTSLPRLLQGTWFEASPEQTISRYDFRANSYDMFDLDPTTGEVNVFNGQPIQVINGRLTNGTKGLHLSPSTEFEEGPFTKTASPDGSQLFLTPVNGGPVRKLTRTAPRI